MCILSSAPDDDFFRSDVLTTEDCLSMMFFDEFLKNNLTREILFETLAELNNKYSAGAEEEPERFVWCSEKQEKQHAMPEPSQHWENVHKIHVYTAQIKPIVDMHKLEYCDIKESSCLVQWQNSERK